MDNFQTRLMLGMEAPDRKPLATQCQGSGQANAAMVFNAFVLLTIVGFALYTLLVRVEERVLHYLPNAQH